jgi:hypothetical protein
MFKTALLAIILLGTATLLAEEPNYEQIAKVRGGFVDGSTVENLGTLPLGGLNTDISFGFPLKGRAIGIGFITKKNFNRVVLELSKMQEFAEEKNASSEFMVVYASDDNKVFKKLDNVKISSKIVEKNDKVSDVITIDGDFDCRFMKFYIDHPADGYVWGGAILSNAFSVYVKKTAAQK